MLLLYRFDVVLCSCVVVLSFCWFISLCSCGCFVLSCCGYVVLLFSCCCCIVALLFDCIDHVMCCCVVVVCCFVDLLL